MPTDTVQLLGAGGHARVVIDALLCCGWPVQRITPRDDRAELAGTLMLGCRIETPVLDQLPPHGQVHAAIGYTREHIMQRFTRRLWSWRDENGSELEWARAVGNETLTASGDGIWPRLTVHG